MTHYVDRLYDSLDITERLFKGYTWDGTRRYAKHTLENVSRMMKAEGRAGAEGNFGMGSVRATLTPIFKNIAQIKKNKDRIVSHEEFEEAKNSLESRYYELVKLTSVERFDNAAEDRLIEALLSLNPKKYLKEEYNIEISDEDAEAIKTFAADLRVMPTEYFETKFERPVMLEEFAKAVIPNDASDKTRKILANAGLEVVEYDPKVEGDRLRAVREASDKEGVRFRFSESEEEFRATQKEAVEKKGIVMPNLADAVVEIVDVPRHNFKGRGIDAINKAKEWANTEIIGSHTYHQGKPDEFEYLIDEKAIDKFLSKSSTAQSDNLGIHLAVLKKLPDVINASIEAEIHADYKKENGKRAIENGVNDANLLIHRLYGAVKIDDKIYRAKTTIHERLGRANKAYDYKVTEIKLIVSGSSASNARTNLTSIDGANLLHEVEKSYDKGKYLLDGSVKNVKSSEEDDDYSGEGGVRFAVVEDEELIKRLDADEKVIGYRNVVLNEDGTFESPMANSLRSTDRKAKEKTGGFELNKWERSEERPHLVDENGKITLVKPDGKAVEKVDYNPYIHNRLNRVNKQFKQAWERPNLVYIKTEIPLSDLESGYHAEKAKLPVGEHKWNGGNLILSRYDKPVEICDWNDVADDWQASFKKKGINFDIIPPALLPILEERGGVRFSVEDSGDKKVEDGVRFRFSETEEEFRATQKEAVEKKGIVMPNLADAVVEIVDVPHHNFKGTLKEAREEAKKWAQDHYVGKEFFMPDNGGTYVISKNAIEKYLDKTSIENSDNASVHLSALTKIPEIISNSITGEIHADYKKDVKGERSVENGIGNSGLLVHRLYGAMNLDNKIYRVKTTMHEFISSKMPNLPHSYEVTKIELIEDSSVTSLNEVDKPLNRSINSINGTKLLQGVEKSYDKGKYLLGGSVKNVKSSEEEDDYSGEGGVRFRFIGEEGAKSMDKKEGTTARMDNLAVAKKMLDEYSYKEVKMATGWEKGMDGKWRYETPDFEQFDINGNLKFEQRHPDYARYRELVKKSKKSIDKYNIKMHRRVQKGSPMLCFRGVGVDSSYSVYSGDDWCSLLTKEQKYKLWELKLRELLLILWVIL